ncbi:hypothetical protein PMAYCL1PPCAC_16434 [Pristionchus mayeri]|uniref:Piwi domain-containing protein n=1 Tax=Pristionchus mayeri TaxID=1317129 RepID=A0AAN5CKY8_9BILA|nr:hypothetical protein PMAYCL1PPCAC_16434 [Pristionchus mayeri]
MEVLQPNWKPPMTFKFFSPATCTKWAIYALLSARDNFSKDDLKKFADALVKRCRERGMEMPSVAIQDIIQKEPTEGKSPDCFAREKIMNAASNNIQFVFFISSEFLTIHKHIKLQERYSQVVTQDLKLKTAQNYLEKNQSLTMENIVFKTNLKLGGINYAINLKNIVGTRLDPFKPTRLIMGIGLSHAPQQNVFTRDGAKILAPTVVGYCANMGRVPTEFIGDNIYQDNKKDDLLLCFAEFMQRVIDRFTGAVDDEGNRTEQMTKPLPKEVIVYRQGVAEGFYSMCVQEEVPLLRAILHSNGAKDVKITYIVVQKEHNIRLMPAQIDTREKATQQNITSGVVVDSQITHPRYREFFLNSHVTLQGTARTPRYTILKDDIDITMNELQSVTHALCHNFQIVNSPVSIPAPLYIANRYAERGVDLYIAKATDDLATSNQKSRNKNEDYNIDLTYGRTKFGKVRINA